MNFLRKQKGITLTGLIMGCIVLGILALGFMKLWPVYNEKFKVDLAMDKLASSEEGNRLSRAQMADILQRQFDVNGIEPMHPNVLAKTLKIEKIKGSKSKQVSLEYEIRTGVTAELDVVLKYSKTVAMRDEKTD